MLLMNGNGRVEISGYGNRQRLIQYFFSQAQNFLHIGFNWVFITQSLGIWVKWFRGFLRTIEGISRLNIENYISDYPIIFFSLWDDAPKASPTIGYWRVLDRCMNIYKPWFLPESTWDLFWWRFLFIFSGIKNTKKIHKENIQFSPSPMKWKILKFWFNFDEIMTLDIL